MAVRTGDADTVAADQIDAELFAQAIDLLRAQRGEEGVEFYAIGFGVVSRIGTHLETGAVENRHVIIPSWVADPDTGIREVALEEIRAHFQRARSAQRLNRCDAARLQYQMFGAEQRRRDGAVVGVEAFHGQIERCLMRLGLELRFCGGNRLELRNDALLVVVEADAEIDFISARILFKGFYQRQNRIAGVGKNVLKHGADLHEWL